MKTTEGLRLRLRILRELLHFFWMNKWWWLVPMLLVLILFGVLFALAQSSPVAPLIYPIF